MLETLDNTIRIGSTPTFLYFDLYNLIIMIVNFNNMCFQSNNRSTGPKLHRSRIHGVGAQSLNDLNRSK